MHGATCCCSCSLYVVILAVRYFKCACLVIYIYTLCVLEYFTSCFFPYQQNPSLPLLLIRHVSLRQITSPVIHVSSLSTHIGNYVNCNGCDSPFPSIVKNDTDSESCIHLSFGRALELANQFTGYRLSI